MIFADNRGTLFPHTCSGRTWLRSSEMTVAASFSGVSKSKEGCVLDVLQLVLASGRTDMKTKLRSCSSL